MGIFLRRMGCLRFLEDEKNKIENICLPIAEETVLMGADVCGYMAAKYCIR